MKRIGYLYEKIYDVENIKLAIRNASKGKRKRGYVLKILNNSDYYAEQLSEQLKNKTYKLSPNKCKQIYDGSSKKIRNITVPRFYPDQVIQWAAIQVLKPMFLKGMYRYSCGSVPRRGAIEAKKYVEKVQNKKGSKYTLKLDIKKFFPSVSNDKLKYLLTRKIKDKDTLDLLNAIIDHGGEGLPIGYYTSQWFSNFYLQNLDHYIKQILNVKHYVRYADDMVLMDSNKRKLRRAKQGIENFCAGYSTQLNRKWQLWKTHSRPLDFVGYRFYEKFTRLRKGIFYRLMRCVKAVGNFGVNIHRARRLSSLMGWAKHLKFRAFYLKRIKPIVSKKTARKYISNYDRQRKIVIVC